VVYTPQTYLRIEEVFCGAVTLFLFCLQLWKTRSCWCQAMPRSSGHRSRTQVTYSAAANALHGAARRQAPAPLPSSSPREHRYLPGRRPQLAPGGAAACRSPGFPLPPHTGPGSGCCCGHPSSPASLSPGLPQTAAQKGTRQ